ncbi:ABC transporter ATP-binding protein [Gulosibacter bifidus]|uniref:ABC transporter ATP-binding protein n=1 Tax=Gulosibacter bifidus TaxID=272239 RepID=A0ABW5RJ42_9MICO|nr:ABC transporter ATP-binding protein [Gulosibacter bifidus]
MLISLLARYLRPQWPFLVGVLVFQLFQALCSLYLPTLNADIINEGVARGDVGYVWKTGMFMLLVALGQITCSIIAIWCGARAATTAGMEMRRDVFDHVAGFSERELSSFGAGSLITRNTNDVQQVQMLVFMSCTMMVSAPMLAIGGIIMAVRQDIGLSWIIAVSVPLLIAVVTFVAVRMVPLFSKYQKQTDAINRVLREQLTGIRVIRAFVREDIERERFKTESARFADLGRRVGNLFVLVFPASMLIMNITIIAVLWFGGVHIEDGSVQIGSLVAYMAYAMQILMGVIMVSFMTMMIPRAAVSAGRIHEVLDTDSTLEFPENGVAEQPTPGVVEFEGVSFAYPGAEQPVLDDVSFAVHPGETLAIIGSTGAGKTTLVNLIPRLFDATAGEIRVGGVPVKDADPNVMWASIGYVPQKAFLFSGTIESNLKFGNEDATEADMWRALEIAQAADFVREMPDQLQSKIAQGGTNVSGGQRQRLSIARAIIHNPKVLVFDDSFSALDLTTDARLRQALWRELPEVTKIVVAQRVTSIADADRILVLEDGRIVGDGTHETLLQDNTTYQEIVESQLGAEASA